MIMFQCRRQNKSNKGGTNKPQVIKAIRDHNICGREISSGDRSLEVSKRRLSCSDVSVNFPAHNATATNITANCPNYPAVIGSNP